MINNITKELPIDDEIKKKIEIICSFCNTTPTFKNGSIRKIDKTNLQYLEQHRIIIKGITYLMFIYSNEIYIGNLKNIIYFILYIFINFIYINIYKI